MCKKLAALGRLDLLQYALERGCAMDYTVYEGVAVSKSMEILEFAWKRGIEWEISSGDAMAEEGYLDGLKWAFKTGGIVLGPKVCYFAAANGHLDTLKWALSNGWTWDSCWENRFSCAAASRGGHLDVVKFIKSHGGNFSPVDAKDSALWNGHVEILEWALSNGGTWCDDDLERARARGHSRIAKWLEKNGQGTYIPAGYGKDKFGNLVAM